ncbi:MAG TPA: cytochrome c oxidase subunit II [Saprospiraceae bacterium]|nr:cytochrome c oxidase subunit II [Saprospiraceae bacterium]HQW55238.1 cytochrome c oxidase subunit II [Saprospiraceae bacterium]
MITLLIIGCILLAGTIIFQVARINEMIKSARGEEISSEKSNNASAVGIVVFGIAFLVLTIWSSWYYKNQMMGYGPHISASEQGVSIDKLFNVTLIMTGIVFVITHILLFYFSWRYRYKKGRKVLFMPHDNKLEVIWTIAPSIVMAYLVINGLVVWNKVMDTVKPGDNHIEIEATGMQFAWILRYPGLDNKLGTRNFKLIDGTNDLGQDWKDPKNWDDFKPDELVLPKGRKVKVRINSRDVLHSFFLPHFRVKMDAVPGIPTSFVFTPSLTTEEYKQNLRKYPEWNVPADPADPTGKKKWETFTYELACAELCGSSHFAMRRPVRVVSDAEYKVWVKSQKSYYMENVRGKDFDPNKGKTISIDPAPSTTPAPEVKSDSTGGTKTEIKKDGADTSLKKIK